MKKITFLITLLTISLSFGQELIVNGDFEALATGNISTSTDVGVWSSSSSNSRIQSVAANAFEGTQYVDMANNFQNLRQYFTGVANENYTVTFRYRNNFAGVVDLPTVAIHINDGLGGNGVRATPDIYRQQLDAFYSADTKEYQEYSFTFQTAETDLVFFIFKLTRADAANPNNSLRIDNVSIVPTSTLSTKKLNQFSFKTYPNPATDVLHISAAKNIDNVEVFNLLGQKAISKSIASKASQVNISSLAKGVYILKAFIDGSEGTYKFVKQ